ncbi:MAG: hypothetical protein KatS3mg060_2322 [Dehalococcoidia bacterium]|nr:MAG: hypothetical protein KatS3mg060_2322 [Dehalococcoidia bacterium]
MTCALTGMGIFSDMDHSDRNGALVNGALIALGALAIMDNVVAHWLLGLHRAVPGPWAGPVEIGLVILGTGLLALGLWQERRMRKW